MNKINFENLPSTTMPLNAESLNTMQDNIEAEIETKIDKELASYTGDLNDIKTTGFTYARGTATNIPVSGHFYFLTTIAINENNIYQRATRLIDDLKLMYTYERQCVSGTWTSWRNIIDGAISKTLLNYTGDLNNIDETGIVYAATSTNVPEGSGYGYCTTIKMSANYMVQYFERRTDQVTYKRFKEAGEWGDWKRIYTSKITTGTEYETGRVIDGKKEYAKRINIGAMPNATTKNIATGLSNITLTRPIEGVMTTSNQVLNLPLVNYGISSNTAVNVYLANTSGDALGIRTNYDWSAATGVVTIYYTKN